MQQRSATSKSNPAQLLQIHRTDVLQACTRFGFTRPQVALNTLEDRFPTILMRAYFPRNDQDAAEQILERHLKRILFKPVMVRNRTYGTPDEIQRLARFVSF